MVNAMSDFREIELLSGEIAALRVQHENLRTSWLLKSKDPVAKLLDKQSEATLAALERKIGGLEAERERLFSEAFTATVGEKTRLEKELKAARQKALELEWFQRFSPEDKLARLGVMRKDVVALKRELSTFEV